MVSIIVPIYNTEQYLNKCLKSIQNQTYSFIEVIMIDDGSTDESRKVANRYVEKDERFRLYSQVNSGVSVARNRGLDLANGEYVLFVDSDDWIEPQMVETLIHNMCEYGGDISCCQYDRNGGRKGEKTEVWDRKTTMNNFLIHKLINGSLVNKLIKREIVSDKKFDKAIKYGEDALFLWKILANINSVVMSPEVLYHVTLHDDSASGGGSYKTIRKDCIKVWSEISHDAMNISVDLGKIARAQLGNMAFFSLYEMAYYQYSDKEHQNYYLYMLRENISDMRNSNFISFWEKCLARIFLFNINIGNIIVHLKRRGL